MDHGQSTVIFKDGRKRYERVIAEQSMAMPQLRACKHSSLPCPSESFVTFGIDKGGFTISKENIPDSLLTACQHDKCLVLAQMLTVPWKQNGTASCPCPAAGFRELWSPLFRVLH